MIHFLKEERWALVMVVLLALLMQLLEYRGWLAGPEGILLDTLLGQKAQPGERENPVTLLDIDDAAYEKCFEGTSPLAAGAVAALVNGVATEAQPWVIGVDILTDSEKFTSQYRALERNFRTLTPNVVWIAGTVKANFEVAAFGPWLLGGHDEMIVKPTRVLGYEPDELAELPKLEWGVPVYPRDGDSGLRRFPRTVELSADPEHSPVHGRYMTWARLIAQDYCRSGARCRDEAEEEVLVPYSAPEPGRVHVLELFDCPEKGHAEIRRDAWAGFRKAARGRIVLIGGSFRNSGDFHDTPKGRLDGMTINAYAVLAEIEASGVHEAARRIAVAFDMAVGFLIVLLTWRIETAIAGLGQTGWKGRLANNEIRLTMAASGLVVAAAAFVTLFLFGRGYLLSFLGVGIGVLLHQLAEIWLKNPKMHHGH